MLYCHAFGSISADSNLQGSLPTELGLLRRLKTIHLDSNFISGALPRQLSSLSELQILRLSNNRLVGSIPTEIGEMVRLSHMDLSENEFTGEIPSSLGSLTLSLAKCILFGNKLEGPIPTELGRLRLLHVLDLMDNLLVGTIPKEYGNLDSLRELYLADNDLTGTVPVEMTNLHDLTTLYLHGNDELSGTIPTQYGESMGNLTHFTFHKTRISGNVDAFLCQNLDGSSNPIVPSFSGDQASSQFVELTSNCLGPDPQATCTCCTHCCNSVGTECL